LPKQIAIKKAVVNHQTGKKKTPIAYFIELIKTTSLNKLLTLLVSQSGIKLGTLNKRDKMRLFLLRGLRLDSFS